jgi:hypothetical protein
MQEKQLCCEQRFRPKRNVGLLMRFKIADRCLPCSSFPSLFGFGTVCLRYGLFSSPGSIAAVSPVVPCSCPTWKSAACAAACSCNSARSSLGLSVFACFRSFLRRALSLCRCCRACSFWRLLNVDRPLGIIVPQFTSPSTPAATMSTVRCYSTHRCRDQLSRQKTTLCDLCG